MVAQGARTGARVAATGSFWHVMFVARAADYEVRVKMKQPVSGLGLPPEGRPGLAKAAMPATAGWTQQPGGSVTAVLARIDDPDPRRANTRARQALADGAAGLCLVFEDATTAFGQGLPATEETVAAVLDGVALDGLTLRMEPHPASRNVAGWLVAYLAARRADPARLRLSLGIDPAAVFARNGWLNMSVEALKASMPQSMAHFFAMGVPGVLLEADGRVFHNAGASPAQEIGAVLAIASGHLKLFEQARQALVYAAPHIGFALGAGESGPAFAAKADAVRRLWAQILAGRSIEAGAANVHAETSSRIRDPLAAKLACAAALSGKVDSLAVLAFDEGDAAARAAMHLALDARTLPGHAEVGDFAALVESLCEAGRAEFLAIEREGGILDSLAAGHLQARILNDTASQAPEATPTDGATCRSLDPL